MRQIFGGYLLLISPFLPCTPFPFVHVTNHPLFTWKSLFDARGANFRPHSSLVGDNCPPPPLTLPPPRLPPTVPFSSPYMFSKMASQNHVHSLIQGGSSELCENKFFNNMIFTHESGSQVEGLTEKLQVKNLVVLAL